MLKQLFQQLFDKYFKEVDWRLSCFMQHPLLSMLSKIECYIKYDDYISLKQLFHQLFDEYLNDGAIITAII